MAVRDSRIRDAADLSQRLSKQLIEAGKDLAESGVIPDQQLFEELHRLRGSFDSMKQDLEDAWQAVGQKEMISLSTLHDLMQSHDDLERLLLKQSKNVWLQRAATVKSTTASDDALLVGIREQALLIYTEAQRMGELKGELEIQAMPYVALARLLSDQEALTDDELLAYDQLVRGGLPGQVSIARMRGRLFLEPSIAVQEDTAISESLEQQKLKEAKIPVSGDADSQTDSTSTDVHEPEGSKPAAVEVGESDEKKNNGKSLTGQPTKSAIEKIQVSNVLAMDPTKLPNPLETGDRPHFHSIKLYPTNQGKAVRFSVVPQQKNSSKESASVNTVPDSTATKPVAKTDSIEALEGEVHSIEASTVDAQADEIQAVGAVEVEKPAIEASEQKGVEQSDESEAAAAAETVDSPPRRLAPAEEAESTSYLARVSASTAVGDSLKTMETRDLAASLVSRESWDQTDYPVLQELFWRLIADNRVSYAYRIAEYLEQEGGEQGRFVPAIIIRSVLLAQHIRHNSGRIMHVLKEDYEKLLVRLEVEADTDESVRNLLAAAVIRPAILAPDTNGAQLLSQLHFTGTMNEWMKELEAYGASYMPLDIGVLRNIRSESGWQAEMKQFQTRTKTVMHSLQAIRILFYPALKVWMKWFEPNGLIPTLLAPVLQNDFGKLEWLKEQVKKYSDPAAVKDKIEYTDRYEVERSLNRSDIIGRALTQLQSNLTEIIDLAREWIDLVEAKPGNSKEYYQRQAKGLQHALRKLHDPVFAELTKDSLEPLPIRASRAMLCTAIKTIYDLFDPLIHIQNKEVDPYVILNRDFLMIPSIALKENGKPVKAVFPVRDIIQSLAGSPLSPEDVFSERLEREDLEGAGLLLKLLEPGDELREEWKNRYDKRMAECREALLYNIRDAVKRVEQDFTFNLLSESERSDLLAHLETMERGIEDIYYFPEKKDLLDTMRAKLDSARKRSADRMWAQFQEAGLKESDKNYSRIRHLLDEGDLHTANEYLSRFQQGVPFEPDELVREPFREFFEDSKFFSELEHYLETARARAVQDIKRGRNVGPLSMTNVPGAQLNQAADMLNAWFKAKYETNSAVVDERYLRSILNGIGLNILMVQRQSPTRNGRAFQLIQTDILSDQNRCPIPHFGSEASGQYRIFSFWDRLSEEDILHEIGETSHGQPPVIVFYFGRMTDRKRRDLARLSKERRRTFLLLDEMLILYLCGVRGSRLPVFFKCAMPFTYLEPYTTTGSLIPPEMFYGRKDELRSIIEGKSGLVYGGRQLGKTALLREAERNFHKPSEGRYAVWIDLKAEGIGYNKPADEVWNLIARELNRIGLTEIKQGSVTPEKLFDQIKTWLESQSNRRILLLLDESDRFLEIDANDFGPYADKHGKNRAGFIRCSRIKGVIERTEKRFHVVFAGLHNVQRSVKNQNDPLAHLGRAICVGPLLTKDEWQEAWNLIEKPFAAMGYFFESKDLIIRILSQTNYYPSLIQLYCHQLLRHMTEHRALASTSNKTPPYYITSRHVHEAYQDRELQQAIRHRFQLTLQLDPRYELIAYTIAHESLSTERYAQQGIPVRGIREQAIAYWSEGMQGIAADSFRILLDEMVELGVLRRVSEGFYALRSPNLLSLMGSVNEIEDELLREDREIRNEYNASNFRSAYINGGVDISLRSPLTAEQESEFNHPGQRISVIVGNRCAGVTDVKKFLQLDTKHLHVLNGVTDLRNFTKAIKEQVTSKKSDMETLVLVDVDCAWSLEWLKEARHLLETSKLDHVRIVFLADPDQMYVLVKTCEDVAGELTQSGVLILQLKQWHEITLGQWLSDCEFEKSSLVQKEIVNVTGNWPSILNRLYEKAKINPHQLRQHIESFWEYLHAPDVRSEIMEEMGIHRKEDKDVLGVLVILEEASMVDLQSLCMDEFNMPEQQIRPILQWAEMLGLVRYVGKDSWRIDPVVGRLLQPEKDASV